VVTVSDVAALVDAVVDARTRGAGAVNVELAFDAARDAPDVAVGDDRDPSIAARLPARELATDDGPLALDMILAGSGVIRAGAVDALRGLADATGLGVLNVFTAKGLFRWDSPYHLGTAGLQLHDFAYAGLAPDRPVLAVGVGRDECPAAVLADAGLSPDGAWPITQVTLDRLPSLAGSVRASHDGPPVLGELHARLSGVAQPLYLVESVPLNPARAAADVAESLPEGGVVTLAPGHAGWWVARTLPTTQLGSVRVPATASPGLALAAAVLFALDDRPVVAVVDELHTPEHDLLLDFARRRGLDLVVAVWGADGAIDSPEHHRALLTDAFARPGVTELAVPIDYTEPDRLLTEAAGPLAAWQQLS
jgi:thiamine pyrophosphate-dependent acetolactate synthase large subunit-like protein